MKIRCWFLLPALFALLAMTGCAAMPTAGEPHAFDMATPTTEPVEQLGFGPQQDAEPERIISDFLRASAAGATDDYATARLYLAENSLSTWDPRSGVVIYPTDKEPGLSVEEISSDRAVVTLEAPVSASLAENGVLSAHDGALVKITFTLERRADGQWRIQQLDDGIILSVANFQAGFQFAQLYFLATDEESLIPDPRWFPRRRLASHLVTGMLAGPSEQLAPAVSSALTSALTLPTQGVEVQGQVAMVYMEGELPSSEQTQLNIARQLSATLLQLTNVTAVEAEINSFPLPSVEDPFQDKLDLDAAVGLRGVDIMTSDGEVWEPILSVPPSHGEISAPARNALVEPTVAWIEGQDTIAVWDGASIIQVAVPGATAPSVDRWGWVWSVAERNQVVALDSQGMSTALELPGELKGVLRKIAVSPDGARLLLLYSRKGELYPYTATITRETSGAPRRLSAVQPVGMVGGGVLDGSWAGYSHLVFLSSSGEDRVVTTAALGGFAQTLGAPADAVRISGGAQSNQILLSTEDGRYYSRSGGVWLSLETDVEMISYAD